MLLDSDLGAGIDKPMGAKGGTPCDSSRILAGKAVSALLYNPLARSKQTESSGSESSGSSKTGPRSPLFVVANSDFMLGDCPLV
eukprot:515663-Rhodomonas_salina.1